MQRLPNSVQGRFALTGGFISVTSEQRRRLLDELIAGILKEVRPDISVESGAQYLPDYSREYLTSIVRIGLIVPESVHPSGRAVLKITVPPTGGWSLVVIQRVIGYFQTWLGKQPA